MAVANNDNDAQHLVIDLAACMLRVVEVEKKLPLLGEFAGIAIPDVGWAAGTSKWGPTNPVFTVAPDGTTQQIADGMEGWLTVLPSASRPAELARAAVLDGVANFSVGGVWGKLTRPVKPWCQSLVRLHGDVFLYWDKNSEVWVTACIVVP